MFFHGFTKSQYSKATVIIFHQRARETGYFQKLIIQRCSVLSMKNIRNWFTVQGSRFRVKPDFIAIFFMFPERHHVFLGLCVQNRLAYQKTG